MTCIFQVWIYNAGWDDKIMSKHRTRWWDNIISLDWWFRLWMGTSWSAPSCPWPVGEGSWRTWPWRCRRCRGTGSPCPKPHGSSTSHPWAFRERRSCSWPAKKGQWNVTPGFWTWMNIWINWLWKCLNETVSGCLTSVFFKSKHIRNWRNTCL